MFPKPKRHQDSKLLEIVRNQKCTVCQKWPSDPHHITSRGAGGGDTGDNVIPLCRKHHTEWHSRGPIHMVSTYVKVYDWLKIHDRIDILDKLDVIPLERQFGDS